MNTIIYGLYQYFGNLYKKSLHRQSDKKLNKTKDMKMQGSNMYARIRRVENAVRIFRKNPKSPPVRNKVNVIELQQEIIKEERKLG